MIIYYIKPNHSMKKTKLMTEGPVRGLSVSFSSRLSHVFGSKMSLYSTTGTFVKFCCTPHFPNIYYQNEALFCVNMQHLRWSQRGQPATPLHLLHQHARAFIHSSENHYPQYCTIIFTHALVRSSSYSATDDASSTLSKSPAHARCQHCCTRVSSSARPQLQVSASPR
jgi:hypothetical protein